MSKSEERKPLPKYTYVIVAVMAVVFVVRLFMPANFGTTFDKIGLDAKEITVTAIDDEKSYASYGTNVKSDVDDFRDFLSGWKLRYATLADTMKLNGTTGITKYSFLVISNDGTYYSMSIDTRGYVLIGTAAYKIAGDKAQFIAEMADRMSKWTYIK